MDLDINRRTKINTNSSTNRGDGIIDVNENVLTWYGSLQGGAGSLRVISRNGDGGMLILGTNWVTVPNFIATHQMTFTIDPNVGSAFYRLVYP